MRACGGVSRRLRFLVKQFKEYWIDKMKTKYIIWLVMICWVWAGMLGSISFMEAPVKFTAPSLTLQVGVDVGRHVFQALNRVELVLCTVLVLLSIISKAPARKLVLPFAVALLLLLETAWLLPVLDERALKVIAGETPPSTYHHWMYVSFEVIKLAGLLISGSVFFNLARAGTAQK